jgi:16S rRNA (guanine527-N7)-methyltransferase
MPKDASSKELLAQLNQGIRDLQVDISAAQVELLMDYLIEFQRWNRTHNLSAIHDLKESVVLHLLDSLAVLPYLDRYVAALPDSSGVFSLADLGTGGGLPGIPLAICRPTWQIHLMEAVQKKTVFLQHIAAKFNLLNIQVHAARIENSSPKLAGSISACISRAFSDFGKFVELSQPMLKDGGVLWAMKAKLLEEDLKTIPPNWSITNNYQLAVPGLNAERRLFELAPMRELQA